MKETFEWIKTWCDYTADTSLPRVLLVGDSITCGYESIVREKLRGRALVDYMATSYAIDSKMYNELVKNLVNDSNYALVHFNHGLHGIHLSARSYESRMRKLLSKISAKIVLTKTTTVNVEGNKRPHAKWMKRVHERNEVVDKLAVEKGYAIDDLYSVSDTIALVHRSDDGTHFKTEGYDILSESVVESVLKNL